MLCRPMADGAAPAASKPKWQLTEGTQKQLGGNYAGGGRSSSMPLVRGGRHGCGSILNPTFSILFTAQPISGIRLPVLSGGSPLTDSLDWPYGEGWHAWQNDHQGWGATSRSNWQGGHAWRDDAQGSNWQGEDAWNLELGTWTPR